MSSFEEDKLIARRVFERARDLLPSAFDIFREALKESLPDLDDRDLIKENFSRLVADVQDRAYEVYLAAEGAAVGTALQERIEPLLSGSAAAHVFTFLKSHPFVLDRLYLSLTQSRRTRAGQTFELVVTTLFQALGYPYTAQPTLGGSTPDYVLPNIQHYEAYATDCMLFSCKRTLRERWRQVVTEGATGQPFFLATIDDRLSGAQLAQMQQKHVILVVPSGLKAKEYSNRLNVISFEDFFEHRLDPAVKRWQASGVVPA